jgi:hypothetical protein
MNGVWCHCWPITGQNFICQISERSNSLVLCSGMSLDTKRFYDEHKILVKGLKH